MTPNATDKTQPWFDTFGNALACYQAVWLHDPTGPLADAALFRVANAHFRRGEWEDAAENYDMLRKNHPKSKYQKDAHLLELQAKTADLPGPQVLGRALERRRGNRQADAQAIPRPTGRRGTPRPRRPWR